MTILNRSEWYDVVRDTNWVPKYVSQEELFPDVMCGSMGISFENWTSFDEPYKQSYPEYVKVQREKDSGAYSVKAALERSDIYENAVPGWKSVLKLHYGVAARSEFGAASAEARMVRFGPAPGMRNMATMGSLDETRHGQIQLYFPHEHISKSKQFDWAHKTYDTNQWAAIAARSYFDDVMLTRDAIGVSIMLTFGFETAFTNMQFLGLAADAAENGDFTFSNLISSIQTDESRHAQIGGAALKVLLENGKKEEAQKLLDISFWRSWRVFTALTGPAMDYYTPLEHRKSSFKEFMYEFIINQFVRALEDLGLDKPWYWDIFIDQLDSASHCQQMGFYFWKPTLWWDAAAGVTPEERDWLEEKYPGWNDSWGQCWDVMVENMLDGNMEKTYPENLPYLCNMSQLPIIGRPGKGWDVKDYPLEYKGRIYHFGSVPDRWCFEQDPERYANTRTLVDRFLGGEVQPPTLEGILNYMSLGPGEIGDDAEGYAWLEAYKNHPKYKKAS